MADTQELKNLAHNMLSVDGLPKKAYRKANKIHLGITALAILGGIIVLIEMVLNYCGARATQVYIGLVLNFILIFYFTRPKLLPLLYVKKVRFVIAHILLFCTTMSLLLFLVPIKSNPNMVAAFFLFGLSTIYLDCVYGIHSKTYRRLSIFLVYTIAIFTVIATPSRALYMKWLGFYPLEVIYTSELEEKVSELETLQNKMVDESKEAKIDYYIRKIEDGKPLTEQEAKDFEKTKEELKRGKVPSAIRSSIDAIKDAVKKAELEAEIERLKAAVGEATKKATITPSAPTTNSPLIMNEGYHVLVSHRGEATTDDFIKAPDDCYFYLRWDEGKFNHFKVVTRSGKEFSPAEVKTGKVLLGGLHGEEIKIVPTENRELVVSLQVLRS